MKLHVTSFLTFVALTTTSSAATSTLPIQILCIPDEHYRAGITKADVPGSAAHLFEYGGKVTITENDNKTRYSYGKGQSFYNLREKTAYSKDFVNIQHDIFLDSSPNWKDSNGLLILRGEMETGYFNINLIKQRYYGFIQESGAIHSYAGPCKILKN